MSEEWGPWIAHDGKSNPLRPGLFVHIQFSFTEYIGPVLAGLDSDPKGWHLIGTPHSEGGVSNSWIWAGSGPFQPVSRYKIRKPPGLIQLKDMIAAIDVPEGVPA